MKVLKNATIAALVLFTSCAALAADPVPYTVPPDSALQTVGITRAKVIADLLVWHLSGLDKFDNYESDTYTDDEYLKAMARYNALRSSPEFQKLVKRVEQDPTTKIVAR